MSPTINHMYEVSNFFLIWHTASNAICAISFWGVALAFYRLLDIVENNFKKSYVKELRNIWYTIGSYRYIYNLISLVFLFCGSGHLVEAIMPFIHRGYIMEFIHGITAIFGATLVGSLWREFT